MACDGVIKTATVSFGQAMPEAEMRRAREETLACDLFLAVGSSLVVFPAAGFPALAKDSGAALVIVNREPTGLDAGLPDWRGVRFDNDFRERGGKIIQTILTPRARAHLSCLCCERHRPDGAGVPEVPF